MDEDRFRPPRAPVRDVPDESPRRRVHAWVFAGMVALQTVRLASSPLVASLASLVGAGALRPLAALACVVASVALAVGAMRLAWRRRGAVAFALAVACWFAALVDERWLYRSFGALTLPSVVLAVGGCFLALVEGWQLRRR